MSRHACLVCGHDRQQHAPTHAPRGEQCCVFDCTCPKFEGAPATTPTAAASPPPDLQQAIQVVSPLPNVDADPEGLRRALLAGTAALWREGPLTTKPATVCQWATRIVLEAAAPILLEQLQAAQAENQQLHNLIRQCWGGIVEWHYEHCPLPDGQDDPIEYEDCSDPTCPAKLAAAALEHHAALGQVDQPQGGDAHVQQRLESHSERQGEHVTGPATTPTAVAGPQADLQQAIYSINVLRRLATDRELYSLPHLAEAAEAGADALEQLQAAQHENQRLRQAIHDAIPHVPYRVEQDLRDTLDTLEQHAALGQDGQPAGGQVSDLAHEIEAIRKRWLTGPSINVSPDPHSDIVELVGHLGTLITALGQVERAKEHP